MDNRLITKAKLAESKTKKDIKVTARNLAIQTGTRLMDIIYDDNPHWDDYMANTTASGLWF